MSDIKNKALVLIKSNLFLSVDQKEEWEARVFFMKDKEVAQLIEILRQNQKDIEGMLKKVFEKYPKIADKLAAEIKGLKTRAQKGVATASHAKDAATAEEQLAEDLKNV